MRIFLIALMLLALVALPAFAKASPVCSEGEKLTDEAWFHQHCYEDIDTDTDTDTTEKQKGSTYGVGANFILWKNDTDKLSFIEELRAEYKYDLRYEDHSAYAVVQINLWDQIKKLFTKEENQ